MIESARTHNMNAETELERPEVKSYDDVINYAALNFRHISDDNGLSGNLRRGIFHSKY